MMRLLVTYGNRNAASDDFGLIIEGRSFNRRLFRVPFESSVTSRIIVPKFSFICTCSLARGGRENVKAVVRRSMVVKSVESLADIHLSYLHTYK